MYRIRIVNDAGLVLDLAKDQVISMEENTLLFNPSDQFIQDFSMPGVAPFTDQNKLFFKQAHLIERKNTWYIQPVTFYFENSTINKGNIRFAIREKGYEFNLEPNYTAMSALVTGIRMPEIRSGDANGTINNAADFAAMMLDSVKFPDKYPYIFFPVYNPGMATESQSGTWNFVNFYDPTIQAFRTAPLSEVDFNWNFGQVPFWKLGYIISQVCKYLGFTATGSYLTDPDTRNICVYTRYASKKQFIYPSMMYMPNMLVSDFLKQVREREHVTIDFNLATGEATVESLASILRSKKVVDLTPYIGSVIEQEVPDGNGYKVTLKSDEQDANFKVTVNDADTYPPLFQLIAGNGTTDIEMACSTTNVIDFSTPGIQGDRYPSVNQTIINFYNREGYPADIALQDPVDPTTLNNWPLRLIKYEGFKAIPGNGNFPCAGPHDLGPDDEIYYRFMNDSKRLIITTELPATVLKALRKTEKYCFRTVGHNYVYFLIEQLKYDVRNDSELIETQIYARTINDDAGTKTTIQPVANISTDDAYWGIVKAYFDNGINGVDQVQVEFKSVSTAPTAATFTVGPITVPTNARGTGGIGVPIIKSGLIGATRLIVRQGKPKYVEHFGIKTAFTWSAPDNYWYALVNRDTSIEFIDSYWIVF